MHLSFALVLVFLVPGCASGRGAASFVPSPGAELPVDAEAGGELPVSDFPDLAGLHPFELVRGDVTFTIGADEDGRVRYIATSNPDFTTPDGIGTATGVADLLRRGLSGDFASPEVAITPESRSVYALRSGVVRGNAAR